jgi:hypothetical protein
MIAVQSILAVAIAHALVAQGVPKWLCWTAFATVVVARLTHGWITTQRPVPAGPLPARLQVPLDIVTLGTLFGAVIQ